MVQSEEEPGIWFHVRMLLPSLVTSLLLLIILQLRSRCSRRSWLTSCLHGLPESVRLQSHSDRLGHHYFCRNIARTVMRTSSFASFSKAAAAFDERL
jgi:hypothetical protein